MSAARSAARARSEPPSQQPALQHDQPALTSTDQQDLEPTDAGREVGPLALGELVAVPVRDREGAGIATRVEAAIAVVGTTPAQASSADTLQITRTVGANTLLVACAANPSVDLALSAARMGFSIPTSLNLLGMVAPGLAPLGMLGMAPALAIGVGKAVGQGMNLAGIPTIESTLASVQSNLRSSSESVRATAEAQMAAANAGLGRIGRGEAFVISDPVVANLMGPWAPSASTRPTALRSTSSLAWPARTPWDSPTPRT
jgi:hypothetical protein